MPIFPSAKPRSSGNRSTLSAARKVRIGITAGLAVTSVALSACATTPGAVAQVGSGTTLKAAATVAASPGLPFAMSAAMAPSATKKLAFAHYLSPFQLSDNKPVASDVWTTAWMAPRGENNKHAAYGGFVRDRPIPRAPLTATNWQFLDYQTEIRQAISGGLDGFTLDLLTANPNSYNYKRDLMIMDAAAATNSRFKIMLMPDMVGLAGQTNAGMAALIAKMASKKAAFRLADGRLVVSPFKAEAKSAAWWKTTLNILKNNYKINVAFVPCFILYKQNAPSFASISYGFSTWGNRNPMLQLPSDVNDANYAHSMGKLWMQPVSVQDERPNQGIYDEAGNTENLRDSWTAAIQGKADWVQIPSWNDWSEGSSLAPSAKHGYSYLDISAWFASRWKTGAFPTVTRDVVYVSHRTQTYSARPSFPQTKLMQLRAIGTRARNTVEVLSVLRAPATVTAKVGSATYSYTAPAGMYAKTFPLAYGKVSALAKRSGTTVASVASPFSVTSAPYVQDLQYVAASSAR